MLSEPEICERLRELSKSIPGNLTVKLPALSPDKWFDGTVENAKMWDVNFIDVNLAESIHFIADMM